MDKTLYDEIEKKVINYRRIIHKFAETGGNEIQTSSFIKEKVASLNLQCINLEGTGCVAILDTGRPGKRIALRADIDALPIAEDLNNMKQKKVCVSDNPNTCHACGHDAHSAMLLGVINILLKIKNELNGIIYFCFEEGEENRSGYKAMIRCLEKLEPDTVLAMHVNSQLEVGKITVAENEVTTGVVPISFVIHGKGGHSAKPNTCCNPLLPACEFVSSIYSSIYNVLKPGNTLSMAITSVRCGAVRNVIAEDAIVEGSVRYFDINEGRIAKEIIKREATYIAEKNRCSVEFMPVMDEGYIPIINNLSCVERAREVVVDLFGQQALVCEDNSMASESFGYYTEKYKGVFVSIGTGNEDLGTIATHHNPHFDIDESVLINGVKFMVNYTKKYLGEE